MPYPVGREIAVPDGRTGVVSAVDPAAPEQPTVRVREGDRIEELTVDMSAPDGGEGNRTPTSAVQRPRAPIITTPPAKISA